MLSGSKIKNSTKRKCRRKNFRGFTLVEMLVAIFVSSLVFVAATGSFASIAAARKKAVTLQRGMENARTALEAMTKNMRMGTIYTCNNDLLDDCSGTTLIISVEVYNYSQGQCFQYKYDSGSRELKINETGANAPGGKLISCDAFNVSNEKVLAGEINSAKFKVVRSSAGVAGRMTAALEICGDSACSNNEIIQTTVSLRDYDVMGI